MLFKPFRLETWLTLGFAAFLAQLSQMFGQWSNGLQFTLRGNGENPEEWADGLRSLLAEPFWLFVGAVVLVLVVVISTVLLWVSCRGRFVFLDDVVRDRVAIVPYFLDWFENYGEGSSGEFYCAAPVCGVRAGEGDAAPYVRTTTWLKPYDLGVSQDVEMVVRHLPETGDNVATVVMTRKSGDRESWERCCHAFVGMLRRRFLTWRAGGESARAALLERGRRALEEATGVRRGDRG